MPVHEYHDSLVNHYKKSGFLNRIQRALLPTDVKKALDETQELNNNKAYIFYLFFTKNMSPLRKFFCTIGFSQKKDPMFGIFSKWFSSSNDKQKLDETLIHKLWNKAWQQNHWDRDAFSQITQLILASSPVNIEALNSLLIVKDSPTSSRKGTFSDMLTFINKLILEKVITPKNSTAYFKLLTNLFANDNFIAAHHYGVPFSHWSRQDMIDARTNQLIRAFRLIEKWSNTRDKKNLSPPVERYQTIYTAVCLAPDVPAAAEFWVDTRWQILHSKDHLDHGSNSDENEEIIKRLCELTPLFILPQRVFERRNTAPSTEDFCGETGRLNYLAILNGASPELIRWQPKNQPPLSSQTIHNLFLPPVFTRKISRDKTKDAEAPGKDFIVLSKLDEAGINIPENIELCRAIFKSKSIVGTTEAIIQLHRWGLLDSVAKKAIIQASDPYRLLENSLFHIEHAKESPDSEFVKDQCLNFFTNNLKSPTTVEIEVHEKKSPTHKRTQSLPNLSNSGLGLFNSESKTQESKSTDKSLTAKKGHGRSSSM